MTSGRTRRLRRVIRRYERDLAQRRRWWRASADLSEPLSDADRIDALLEQRARALAPSPGLVAYVDKLAAAYDAITAQANAHIASLTDEERRRILAAMIDTPGGAVFGACREPERTPQAPSAEPAVNRNARHKRHRQSLP